MKHNNAKILALLLFPLFACIAESTKEDVAGKIIEFGLIESITEEPIVKTPETTSGYTRNPLKVHFSKKTRQVPATLGIRFGFRYLITGLPENEQVTFLKKVQHPPITKPDGTVTNGFEFEEKYTTVNGVVAIMTGYGFDHDYELADGDWKIEFWYKDKKLFSETFTVVHPQK